ncbi:hypothetical protein ABZ820_34265 [Streptomyces diacarni]|uniref:hypothetical protein n=1 Tax=Streptomyces diacarni TaxID=2800381 RepID=UPI0033EA488A
MSRLTRSKNHVLNFLRDAADVFADDVDIYRKPGSSAVLANCHNEDTEAILTSCGFDQPGDGWRHFHLPQHLTEAEKQARATRAAFHPMKARYAVDLHWSLLCPTTQDSFLNPRHSAA